MSGMAQGAATPQARRIGKQSMLAYGFGAVAYGVKDAGFQTFLLLFYNQVIGLPAVQVGAAIMAALILDAMIDPAIGAASDRTRSRWGRRHPWMYGSAIPIAVGWLLLWNPPELPNAAMLGWVFATAVIVRTAVSAYEVPSVALTPELTADYDERTRIMAYRYLFGWAGGLAMLVAAYTLFLVPGEGQPNGLLNREGYGLFAAVGAAAMAGAILISALGTHHEINRLPRPEIERTTLGQVFRELIETVRNRAFALLMLAGLCAYSAQGISFALSNYNYTFVWLFPLSAFMWLGGVLFVGVLGAFFLAPRVAARWGKRKAAAVFMSLAPVLLGLPYWLRLAGLFPPPGDPAMLPALFGIFIVNTVCTVSAFMLGASMMADVVEQSEAQTGRRSEGVFFAGSFFVQKCTSGIGIGLAGLILWVAGFPDGAKPGQVPEATVDRLTIAFTLCYLALGWGAAWFYAHFPFGKAEHDARIAAGAGAAEPAAG
ncbi:MFS transporter [Sphingomonas sp. MS122]|uniref:MFS transporter n=1 Tax=Sphingomonas sp. MS122 TaxID=3412683 RepID=UPI003C2B391E